MSLPKSLAAILFSVFLLTALGCEPQKTQTAQDSQSQQQVNPGDTSQSALDWHGTYEGILPCADCEGMKTILAIRPDHTYRLELTYLGKSDEPVTYEGSFAWTSDGGTIYLNDLSDRPNRFFIGENFVAQLDLEGQRITGTLKEQYELKKIQVSPLAGSRWRLVELMGEPFSTNENSSSTPTLEFSTTGLEVSGRGPCNSFRGPVTWSEPKSLSFGNLASTKRACPDLESEALFFEVLERADSYHLEGETLQLFRARMAPLAKFQRKSD